MPRHSRKTLEAMENDFVDYKEELAELQIHSAANESKPVGLRQQFARFPWFVTVPLLSLMAYTYTLHVNNRGHRGLIAQASVGIHEIGHLVFGVFGIFMLGVMGGTLTQLLIPIAFIIGFYHEKNYFFSALGWGWLSVNFFYIAMYVRDATRLELPMLSMGASSADQLTHDRNYMLGERNIIQYTDQIAYGFATLGTISMLLCLGYGGWLIYQREMRKIK